jgi:hypothetical protein
MSIDGPHSELTHADVCNASNAALSAHALLLYVQEAGGAFAESLADLPDAQLAHAGADSAGSRALEALLEGPAASTAVRKRALRKLRGSYAALAATPGGSHAVQAAFRAGVRLQQFGSSMSSKQTSCRGFCPVFWFILHVP